TAALHKMMAQNPDVDWNRVKPPFDYGAATLENLRERGLLILGTPDQVFDEVMDQYEQVGGFGTLLAMIRMGSMPQDVVLRTIRLMGEELVDWNVFVQDIRVHSGKHRHQGGLVIYIMEGEGYSVVDGERHDWEAGDLLLLPVKKGGVEHQHFNKDDAHPAKWIAFISAA